MYDAHFDRNESPTMAAMILNDEMCDYLQSICEQDIKPVGNVRKMKKIQKMSCNRKKCVLLLETSFSRLKCWNSEKR